jgi:predicted nucleic acid-binding protein
MLVVDTSAIAEVIVGTDSGRGVLAALGTHTLHAPDIIGLEIVSVLRGLIRSSDINVAEARGALSYFEQLGVEIYDHAPLLARCLNLRDNATPYDAAFIALAESLQAPLLTCDRWVEAAARSAKSPIEVRVV